jgi:hypothetical protein
MKGNKLLRSFKLDANELDFQGDFVADGSLEVKELNVLPNEVAQEYYKQFIEIEKDLRKKVDLYKTLIEIAELEEKVKKLKGE